MQNQISGWNKKFLDALGHTPYRCEILAEILFDDNGNQALVAKMHASPLPPPTLSTLGSGTVLVAGRESIEQSIAVSIEAILMLLGSPALYLCPHLVSFQQA